jgi:hypothetical protein
MGAMLRYSCTALLGLNKQGIVKPNSDGQYELVLSALNYPNPVGAIYRLESARRIIEGSPYFMRRVKEGNLLGEVGHPVRREYASDADYEMRLMEIDMRNTCLQISDVWIDDSGHLKDRDGRSYVGIMGLVSPYGVHGDKFEACLNNPKQNTCLSVRSICDHFRMADRTVEKEFVNIGGWDWVDEPGLRPANKFSSPALESHAASQGYLELEDLPIDVQRMEQRLRAARDNDNGCESAGVLEQMRNVVGYANTKAASPAERVAKAAWTNW